MDNWLARHDLESSGCRHPNFTMQGVICGAAELGTGRSTFKLKKWSFYHWGHAAEEISILCGLVVTVKAPRLVNCLITRCNHGMFEARYSVRELTFCLSPAGWCCIALFPGWQGMSRLDGAT